MMDINHSICILDTLVDLQYIFFDHDQLIDAKKFYDEYCDSKNTAENFKKVFDEYKFYKKTWS